MVYLPRSADGLVGRGLGVKHVGLFSESMILMLLGKVWIHCLPYRPALRCFAVAIFRISPCEFLDGKTDVTQ
jgi:hypothetical protein